MGNPKKKYSKCYFCGVPEDKCKCGKNSSLGSVPKRHHQNKCESSSPDSCTSPSSCPPDSCPSSTCESSSTCECTSSSSCEPSCSSTCESSLSSCEPECSSSSCEEPVMRIKGFLQGPASKNCVNTYLLASCVDVDNLISPPTIMVQARDLSWHFSGEVPPGYPFWLVISPNKSLLLAMPQQTSCFFPIGAPYVLTLSYVRD